MENRQMYIKTSYIPEEKPQSPLRYASKPFSRQNEQPLNPLKISFKTIKDNNKPINFGDITKDFSVNTSFYNKKLTNSTLKDISNSKRKIVSMSPEPIRFNSPKVINLNIEMEEKRYKNTYFVKGIKNLREKLNLSPKLNFCDFKSDLPLCDGNSTIIHKYALPQALIPVRTPSPALKIPSHFEDSVLQRPLPIIRKGVSGWKLSYRSICMGQGKKKSITLK
ncbi:hypothetical protein SteCoe_1771 [Stentor coeruleus]|uniref:Uncharacterized protein n=1 Tax=Stentor coeruleus TaxID=5963 RepID=A0A1R2D0Y1_9CILI|nr:hypothetical protein SteCoe_1771 [Stentor coeruleus]